MTRAWNVAGYTPVIVAMLAAVVVILLVARVSVARGGARLALKATMWTMLAATAGVILVATIGFSVGDAEAGSRVNIHPLVEIRRGLRSSASDATMANLYGNIAMFVPIGVLLVWLWTSPLIARVIMATIAGAGLSLIIELTQLTLSRVADIDDVILNGSGALLGAVAAAVVVVLLRVVKWVRRWWRGRGATPA
ncbi:VanZ family protein [Demequina lutea]|uniref:Glycopeptide antibiotics resistance protein n=1 Tax=Demequina lutea TaxID=431489 RepID=A0A7Y9Z7H8_9MICO|nr:VanZ family protein [Demequina lutea]NYI40239.1 glycopeptide antibiotics resistance protein [Demequina lutea]